MYLFNDLALSLLVPSYHAIVTQERFKTRTMSPTFGTQATVHAGIADTLAESRWFSVSALPSNAHPSSCRPPNWQQTSQAMSCTSWSLSSSAKLIRHWFPQDLKTSQQETGPDKILKSIVSMFCVSIKLDPFSVPLIPPVQQLSSDLAMWPRIVPIKLCTFCGLHAGCSIRFVTFSFAFVVVAIIQRFAASN